MVGERGGSTEQVAQGDTVSAPAGVRKRSTKRSPSPPRRRSPARGPCQMVLIGRGKYRGLATHPLTQTAPDEESEAE